MLSKTIAIISIVIISTFAATLSAETNSKEPFLEGYSPVSYFTAGKPEMGSPEFTVEHKGKYYYLTSAKQLAIFNKNPDKYAPRYDVCPYSLTLGAITPLNPMNFKIVGDTLLLFHKSDNADAQELWNNSDLSDQELIERADKKYTILRF